MHKVLTMDILLEEFPMLTRKDIAGRLAKQRKNKEVAYKDFNKGIELLKARSLKAMAQIQKNELGRLKTWLYIKTAYGLIEDIDSGELKTKEKAMARKEIARIARDLNNPIATTYAKEIEEATGIHFPWQDNL